LFSAAIDGLIRRGGSLYQLSYRESGLAKVRGVSLGEVFLPGKAFSWLIWHEDCIQMDRFHALPKLTL